MVQQPHLSIDDGNALNCLQTLAPAKPGTRHVLDCTHLSALSYPVLQGLYAKASSISLFNAGHLACDLARYGVVDQLALISEPTTLLSGTYPDPIQGVTRE